MRGSFRKTKRIVIVIILISGCDISTTERYTKVEQIKSPLAFGTMSYSSIEEVRTQLLKINVELIVTERKEEKERINIPTFDYVVMSAGEIELDGYQGDLFFVFLNNRLWQTMFYPVELKDFLSLFPNLSATNSLRVEPFTTISLAMDHRNYRYVVWSDSRLEEQFKLWIRKYAKTEEPPPKKAANILGKLVIISMSRCLQLNLPSHHTHFFLA